MRQKTPAEAKSDFMSGVIGVLVRARLPPRPVYSFRHYSQFFPLRASSIAFAAVLPAPIAEMTVAAPVTASPPA